MLDNKKEESLHIAIIGSGSGAFSAAIKAVENGAHVSMIEESDIIGGTCVNIGCVPSKIFIRGAKIAYLQGHHGFEGIGKTKPEIDRVKMLEQQQSWVKKLRYEKYEHILESKPEIQLIKGKAKFKNAHTLIVKNHQQEIQEITADRILLAVGSRPILPAINGLVNTPYWTSTEALVSETIPESLIVLGGSVVALELAQAFSHAGSSVTVMARSTLLSNEDPEIGEELTSILSKEGINIMLHHVPESVEYIDGRFEVDTKNVSKSVLGQDKIYAQHLLVATGRISNADKLQVENAGIKLNSVGNVVIDDHMRTSVEHIFAAGDCTTQPQYVYVAAAAGSRAALNMTGEDVTLDLSIVPKVVFTTPQVASVGLTEQAAQDKGIETESRRLNLENIPAALASMDIRGFIKLVAQKETGLILGCHVVANESGEIIQTISIAIKNKMTIDMLAEQLFPYLTMVEGLKLCAQTFKKDISQLSCCAG